MCSLSWGHSIRPTHKLGTSQMETETPTVTRTSHGPPGPRRWLWGGPGRARTILGKETQLPCFHPQSFGTGLGHRAAEPLAAALSPREAGGPGQGEAKRPACPGSQTQPATERPQGTAGLSSGGSMAHGSDQHPRPAHVCSQRGWMSNGPTGWGRAGWLELGPARGGQVQLN